MKNLRYNNILVEPSGELVPLIRISPFNSSYLYRGAVPEKDKEQCQNYLTHRFKSFSVLPKGRDCIYKCLDYYNLQKDDVVTIFTTSGNFYISSCVTKTIEKFCKWSRTIEKNTRVIFVNHEFGYPFGDWGKVVSYGLPIIEDGAYCFLTTSPNIGKYGDFVLYSLPKIFPVQMGAILQINNGAIINSDAEAEEYVYRNISEEIGKIEHNIDKRIHHYNYLLQKLSPIGINPYFNREEGVIPGVFLFSWLESIDYQNLRVFMEYHGIECSVFYGRNAFYIPLHQNLTMKELDYMIDLLKYYFFKTSQ